MDHIVSLTSIIETRKLKRQSTFTAFIDFTKAYDSINRDLLFHKLVDLGLSSRIHQAIRSLYDNVKCCVRINGMKTEYFEVTCGLKQGCTLSTLLFNLYVNDLVIKINSLDFGIEIDGEKVAILLYADDLVLISATEDDLQTLLNELTTWCLANGLNINQKKSDVVHFHPSSVSQTIFNFKIGEICLETVSQYIYLGILLTEHLDYNKMAKHVAKAANRALGLVIAKSKSMGGLPFGSFIRLFDSMVWSVVSYGAAVWGSKQFACVNSILLRAARYYMGVGKYTPNSAVYGDTGWKPTGIRQWHTVLNHWLRLKRMDGNRLNKKIFEWAEVNANGRCQKFNYRVNKMLEETNLQFQTGITNPLTLKANLTEYLTNKFLNSWTNDINRNNARRGSGQNKLRTYKLFKSSYITENYLNCIMSHRYRI